MCYMIFSASAQQSSSPTISVVQSQTLSTLFKRAIYKKKYYNKKTLYGTKEEFYKLFKKKIL
jgi:hypothetical protein